jgi:chitodextrinase
MLGASSLKVSSRWRIIVAMLIASIALLGCPAAPETGTSEPGTGGGSSGGGSATVDNVAPSAPTGLAATAISPSQISLGWSASTDNVAVTGYRVYRNGALLATPGNVTTYQDSSVSASTSYSYTVQALDSAGNASGQSTALILTTPATSDTTAPSTPTGLTANAVSNLQIDVGWLASTDNVAVAGYRVFRNGSLLVTLGNVTSYQDTGLSAATTYVYTVRALDAAGNVSGLSTAATATTPTGADTIAPSTPTGLNASAVSPSQINLTWSPSTDNVAVAGYRIYRDGAFVAILASVTTYQDTGLTPSTAYSYNVDAIDAVGNASALSAPKGVTTPAVPDTTAPSTPTGLSANAVSASRVNLSWAASTDNVAVTGYRVFRNGTLLVTLGNVTTYANTGLSASTTYTYAVRALDAAGNVSGQSATASATTQSAADTTAPSTPTGLTANAVSASRIDLGWTASTDNVAVTGYRVYRNSVFQTTLAAVTTFQDTGLTASTTYSYNVDAIDAAGNASGISTAAGATTQASGGSSGTPTITGVSGTISQGQSITITGSSFGTKSHAGPMLWDNFDGGGIGAVVANDSTGSVPLVHQGNLSGYSRWQGDGGGSYIGKSTVFDNSSPKANSSLHARSTFTDGSYWGLNLFVPYSNFTTGNDLYFSFYFRMTKTGAAFPRQSKTWIAYDSNWSDRLYWSTAYDNCESGGYRTHITELGPQEHDFAVGGKNVNGEWVRFETYLKQSGPGVANGILQQTFYRPTLATPTREFYSTINQKLRTSSNDFVKWTFGGAYYSMCGSSDTGTVDVDEFYMDDTRARVEVCNASTWSGITKCELQIPTAWSDASITATFNKGYLGSSTTAYVYVIDATGNVNASGFAISVP